MYICCSMKTYLKIYLMFLASPSGYCHACTIVAITVGIVSGKMIIIDFCTSTILK